MDTFAPVPATQAEDLYDDLHEHLVLERLGQENLVDALDLAEPPHTDAYGTDLDPVPGIAP